MVKFPFSTGRGRRARRSRDKSPLRDLAVAGHDLDLRRLGSPYGGWVVAHSQSLEKGTFISAGAGEDISFDVEIAQLYSMRGVLIDPTPRAVAHVDETFRALGMSRAEPYTLHGTQPVHSYDLSGLVEDSLTLIPKALWVDDHGVEFIPPANPDNVSHSIHPKTGNADSAPLKVDTVSAQSLAVHYGDDVVLIKLDIEGAEVDVIEPLLASFPRVEQFLVEFDAEKVIRDDKEARMSQALAALEQHGFRVVHRSGRNILFFRELSVPTGP